MMTSEVQTDVKFEIIMYITEHTWEKCQKFENKKCPKSKTKKNLVNKNLKIPLTSRVEKFL